MIVYRTDDLTRWGTGQGSDLAAVQVDLNFWDLDSRLAALQDHFTSGATVSIDFITVTGNQLFIHLTNHAVEGPFTIPATVWNPRGTFLAGAHYKPLDIISINGRLYLVLIDHIAASTFDALATDGQGHFLYTLILEDPFQMLPDGGSPGNKLVKAAGSPLETAWRADFVRGTLFIGGQPDDNELVLEWPITDNVTFPQGLAGSVAFSRTNAAASALFTINKNDAPIGSITFAPSPLVTVIFPSDVPCVSGDIISILAPSPQDTSLADISFTLLAELT